MILKRLVVPGNFVEAHLYFDFLWLIDASGAVRALDLAAYIDACLNGSGAAAHKLFARNDLLVKSGTVRASEQKPDVRKLLSSNSSIEMTTEQVEAFSYHFAPTDELGRSVSLRFYSGRAFVGVPSSLYQFHAPGRDDLSSEVRRGSRDSGLKLKRVFDEGTPIQIQCRYGSVNIACGPEGGWISLGALNSEANWEAKPKRIVDASFFTEVNTAGVGHVGACADLQLSRTRMDRSQPNRLNDQIERLEVGDVAEKDDLAMQRAQVALGQRTHDSLVAERMFLTPEQALTVMSDDSLRTFAYARDKRFLHTRAQVSELPTPRSRILDITTLAGKIVAECDDDLQIFNGRRWKQIFNEPVYSVRGYPSSKWYRNLLTIVAEGQTQLVFVADA